MCWAAERAARRPPWSRCDGSDPVIRLLLRNGFQKGVLGGGRAWLVLGGVGLFVKLLRKLGGSGPEVVYSEELPVGSAIVIANEPR